MDLLQLLRELGIELAPEATIGDLTDEQIAAAETALLNAFDEARAAVDVARCEALADAVDTIRSEAQGRITAAEEAQARLDELDARVRPAEPEQVEEPETAAETETPAEPAAPAVEPQPEPVMAAAPAAPAAPVVRRMPRVSERHQISPTARDIATAVVIASSQMGGGQIRNIDEMGEDVVMRLRAMQRFGSGQLPLFQIRTSFDDSRFLDSDEHQNRQKLEAVVASLRTQTPEAIVAAGGLCAPTAARYEVDGLGDDRRPIRDGLVRFGADRGGVRGIRPPVLTDMASAVDVITEAEDTASATKPCLTVTCGSDFEDLVSAVTLCLQIGNFNHRFFRENWDRFWRLGLVQHAREAEQNLWDLMVTGSTAVTGTQVLGAFRDFVENMAQLASTIRMRERMNPNETIRVITSELVVPLTSVDLLRQMPGDGTYTVDEAFLRRALAVHNIALTLSPDVNISPAQAANNVITGWPQAVEALVFPEGTWAFLDGGELNFGMEIRDSTLNAANNLRAMTETFEGVSRFGVRSYHVTLDLCPDGSSGGTADINPCAGTLTS